MLISITTSFFSLALFFSPTTHAVKVTNSSTCASDCEGGLTFYYDLICDDADYGVTSDGKRMKSCLLCESTSTEYNAPLDNDVHWFLFNLKYSAQYCLFDDTSDTSGMPDCESDCAPLKPVLEQSWFADDYNEYDYCSVNSDAFGQYADECASCLQGVKGSVALGNFISILHSACQDKPDAREQETVSFQGNLFETETIASSSSTSSVPTTATAATTSSASASFTSSSSPGLSAGAGAGIGVGIGAVAIAAIAGLVWFFLRRRHRRKMTASPSVEAVKTMMSSENPENGGYATGYYHHGPPQQIASTPLVEADGARGVAVDQDRTKAGGNWRAELPS